MAKKTKKWLIFATSLVVIGALLWTVVMTLLGWDFKKLSTVEFDKTSYVLTKPFKDIKVSTKEADIIFVVSEIEATTVECYENKNAKHSVAITDGMLEIRVEDNRKWFQHLGINWGVPKITVHLPKGEYGALSINSSTGKVNIPKDFTFERMDIAVSTGDIDLAASVTNAVKIKASTGDITVENITAKELDLSVTTGRIEASEVKVEGDFRVNASTGDVSLSKVTCRNVVSNANTGDMNLTSVVATETFSIKRTTGDVRFERCDAVELNIETDTGSVEGSLLTPKEFFVTTDTGSVSVPESISGGRCVVKTSTGNVKIEFVS